MHEDENGEETDIEPAVEVTEVEIAETTETSETEEPAEGAAEEAGKPAKKTTRGKGRAPRSRGGRSRGKSTRSKTDGKSKPMDSAEHRTDDESPKPRLQGGDDLDELLSFSMLSRPDAPKSEPKKPSQSPRYDEFDREPPHRPEPVDEIEEIGEEIVSVDDLASVSFGSPIPSDADIDAAIEAGRIDDDDEIEDGSAPVEDGVEVFGRRGRTRPDHRGSDTPADSNRRRPKLPSCVSTKTSRRPASEAIAVLGTTEAAIASDRGEAFQGGDRGERTAAAIMEDRSDRGDRGGRGDRGDRGGRRVADDRGPRGRGDRGDRDGRPGDRPASPNRMEAATRPSLSRRQPARSTHSRSSKMSSAAARKCWSRSSRKGSGTKGPDPGRPTSASRAGTSS